MTRPMREDSLGGRQRQTANEVQDERVKPNLRGFRIYVGDFVDVDDPGNDPAGTSESSPPYLNGLYYTVPIWFAHGLDGETDMGGMYDLSGYTLGDLGWEMPLEWASEAQATKEFIVKSGPGEFWVAVQEIEIVGGVGEVRIWPTIPYPGP